MPSKKKKYNARFPPARIKKIMQSDEEVGKVAAPVPVIISRALELFAEALLKKANSVTAARGARTLTPSHLKCCIHSEARFDFLRDMVASVPELQGDVDCEPGPAAPVPVELPPAQQRGELTPSHASPLPQLIPKPKGRGIPQPRGGRGGGGSQPRGRGRGSPRGGTGRPRGRPRKLPEGGVMPPMPPLEATGSRNYPPKQDIRYVDDPGSDSDENSDNSASVEEVFPVSPPMSPTEHRSPIEHSYHVQPSPTRSFQDYHHLQQQQQQHHHQLQLQSPQTHNNSHHNNGVLGRLSSSDSANTPDNKYKIQQQNMNSHFTNTGSPHQAIPPFSRSHSVPVSDSLSHHPNHHPTLPRTNSISESHHTLPRSPTYHHAQPRRPSYPDGSNYNAPRSPYTDNTTTTTNPLPGHHVMPGVAPSGPPYRPFTSPYDHYRGYGQQSPDNSCAKTAPPQFSSPHSYKTGINGMFSVDKLHQQQSVQQRSSEHAQKVLQSQQNTPRPQQGVGEMDEDYDCF